MGSISFPEKRKKQMGRGVTQTGLTRGHMRGVEARAEPRVVALPSVLLLGSHTRGAFMFQLITQVN